MHALKRQEESASNIKSTETVQFIRNFLLFAYLLHNLNTTKAQMQQSDIIPSYSLLSVKQEARELVVTTYIRMAAVFHQIN